MGESNADGATFWDHLDELRFVIIRMAIAVIAVSGVAFAFKDLLFSIVLAPAQSDFFLFRWLKAEPFNLQLMNTQLTEQFMIHVRVAIYAGILIVSPYILYLLFGFVSPALYQNEKRYGKAVVISAYVMFFVGTALNYFLIFPLTVRFLGTYQVSGSVANMLTISNYVDTMISMNLLMGLVFELPVVCWLAGKMNLIRRSQMRKFRRHAIVAILIVAAIITPTTDMLTLIVVSLPIWLLYEVSILLVKNDN
ncbi:MAG: twin-arginine translocase subunit TatC [Prevotella sp.]|nr:twin-arginine translocase subunit TatC [Prevotella sp.]